MSAISSGRPGTRGPNSCDDSNSNDEEDDGDEEGGGVMANLNLGDSFNWESPSFCTGDWWDETRTRRIFAN